MCYTPLHMTTTFPVVFVYVLHTAAPDHNISCRLCLSATRRGTWPQHFLSSLFVCNTPRHLTTTFPVVFVYLLHTTAPNHNISYRLCLWTPRRLTTRFSVVFVYALHTRHLTTHFLSSLKWKNCQNLYAPGWAYTVKKTFRYSRPQPGCHYQTLPGRKLWRHI